MIEHWSSYRRVMRAVALFVFLGWSSFAWADPISIEFVTVGDAGNPASGENRGAVAYEYQIGKFEVTNGQYTAFLNAVAATDTYDLYNTGMSGYGISRTGSAGSYSYSVNDGWENRPVNYVSWADGARFANWLANGQPLGIQGTGTTEDGSYLIAGANTIATLALVSRAPNATIVLPTLDEWYKAAYYDGAGNYFNYATASNTTPGNVLPDTGNNANHSRPATTDVGSFINSASYYGTFDQAGNIAEWFETIGPRSGNPSQIDYRWFANNSYLTPSGYLLRDFNDMGTGSPLFEGVDYGFRVANVAVVPEASSLVFAAVGALSLAAFRWTKRR
jgi:hypothetical protein